MRQYTYNPHDMTLLVTEEATDAPPPFTLTAEDAAMIDRYIPRQKEASGYPTIIREGEDVRIKRGMVSLVMDRPTWRQFQKDVACVTFPMIDAPDDVEVSLDIRINHRMRLDLVDLLDGDPRWDQDESKWDGDVESLDDAIRDAVDEVDWDDKLRPMTRQFDYVEDVETDTSW